MATALKPEYSASVAKERYHECKTKYLLYGGEDRPDTPVKHGKKVGQVASAKAEAPFATVEQACNSSPITQPKARAAAPFAVYEDASKQAEPSSSSSKHQGAKQKDVQGKVGGSDFDPSVYAANIAANQAMKQQQRAKNWGSNNLISQG